ncbi:hypothetical protein BDR26DRAFT_66745 [Obelidium mucronatum]|nr:hypothetical protein BDR26DRAFT_66745 [Obelidium mucronatum]
MVAVPAAAVCAFLLGLSSFALATDLRSLFESSPLSLSLPSSGFSETAATDLSSFSNCPSKPFCRRHFQQQPWNPENPLPLSFQPPPLADSQSPE